MIYDAIKYITPKIKIIASLNILKHKESMQIKFKKYGTAFATEYLFENKHRINQRIFKLNISKNFINLFNPLLKNTKSCNKYKLI